MILTMLESLVAQSEVIRQDLITLLELSRVVRRRKREGGRFVVITATPFNWEPLPAEGRAMQRRLREAHSRFVSTCRVVTASENASLQKDLDTLHTLLKSIIDQDGGTSRETVDEHRADALEALDMELQILRELPSLESDPILVPDTNALLHNPALERWRFADLPTFRLVLTPAVLSELDMLKVRHSVAVVRDKSERLVRQIGEYIRRGDIFAGVPLHKGVSTICSVAVEPKMDRSLPWLDPQNNDDRLLASTLEIARQHIRVPVALVTRDVNAANKAAFARLPILAPPDHGGEVGNS
jgi:hypothetical protein